MNTKTQRQNKLIPKPVERPSEQWMNGIKRMDFNILFQGLKYLSYIINFESNSVSRSSRCQDVQDVVEERNVT